MIANPFKYGCLDNSRIEIIRSGLGSDDFFAIEYATERQLNIEDVAQIDPEGNPDKIVEQVLGMKTKILKAGFDIISVPYSIPAMVVDTFWVQVKTNALPTQIYIETLKKISAPYYVKKELHIWHDNQKQPQIIEL